MRSPLRPWLGLGLAVLSAFTSRAAETRALKPEDFAAIRDVSDPQLSPDGAWVAYTVKTTDLAKDKSHLNLWLARWDGAENRALTFGENKQSHARWSPDGRFIVTRNDGRKVRIWEAATGEAVTPLLDHSGDVGFAFMTRDSRLITASEPNLIRAWELSPTTLPPEVLADYAKLASGRRLNAAGVMLSLTPLELGELARSLRQRAPELMRFQKTTAAQPSAEPRKRRISAAGRVRIPPAAKARWARFHAERAMMSGK